MGRIRKAFVRFVGAFIAGVAMQYVIGYLVVGHPLEYPIAAGLGLGTGFAIMTLLFG